MYIQSSSFFKVQTQTETNLIPIPKDSMFIIANVDTTLSCHCWFVESERLELPTTAPKTVVLPITP